MQSSTIVVGGLVHSLLASLSCCMYTAVPHCHVQYRGFPHCTVLYCMYCNHDKRAPSQNGVLSGRVTTWMSAIVTVILIIKCQQALNAAQQSRYSSGHLFPYLRKNMSFPLHFGVHPTYRARHYRRLCKNAPCSSFRMFLTTHIQTIKTPYSWFASQVTRWGK